MAEDDKQPSEQELIARLEAELRKLKVSDVLAQTVVSVSSLGFRRLQPGEERDLDQARLAIEALRALVPVLEGSLPDGLVRDFKQAVANMQLAYAKAASEGAPAPERDDES